jgi:hypothetical protein
MRLNAGDVFCVYSDRLGKYTAYQITRVFFERGKEMATLLVLDWTGDQVLAQHELRGVKPLMVDCLYGEAGPRLTNVEPKAPIDFIYAGNRKPLIEKPSKSYGFWGGGDPVYRQMKWLEVPAKQRRIFKKAIHNKKRTLLAGREVNINSHSLSDAVFDYDSAKELKVLPCLGRMECERWHPDLYEYLKSNPFLREISLRGHNQKALDFRKSHLTSLKIEVKGVEEIYLNDDMEDLALLGEPSHPFRIHAREDGAFLRLDTRKTVCLDCGLKNLSKIHCQGIDEIDLQVLADAYPNLSEIRLWGKPGYIRHFDAIRGLGRLHTFSTVDLFGFTAADIPKPEELPKLAWFWMSSLPDDAARAARRLYQKKAKDGLYLWITQARKPGWLKENMDNPFRSWDGQENITPANAKKAAAQYRATRSAIQQLVQNPTDSFTAELTKIVADYAEAFTQMDRRRFFIETQEWEEIYLALCGLLDWIPAAFGVDKEALLDVYDKHRDF